MDVPSHAEIVAQVDAFLVRRGMKPSRFGREALREPQFVKQLRDGRMPGLATLEKLRDFMREQDEEASSVISADRKRRGASAHRLNAGAR